MNLHANAALSLRGRRELCRQVPSGERTLTEAADRLLEASRQFNVAE